MLGLGLTGGLLLLLWSWQTRSAMLLVVGVFGVWMLGCATAWHRWLKTAVGQLIWREQTWYFCRTSSNAFDASQSSRLTDLRVAVDVQAALLIQARSSEGRSCWIWLSRRDAPASWNAVRRAVYARVSAAGAHPVHRLSGISA